MLLSSFKRIQIGLVPLLSLFCCCCCCPLDGEGVGRPTTEPGRLFPGDTSEVLICCFTNQSSKHRIKNTHWALGELGANPPQDRAELKPRAGSFIWWNSSNPSRSRNRTNRDVAQRELSSASCLTHGKGRAWIFSRGSGGAKYTQLTATLCPKPKFISLAFARMDPCYILHICYTFQQKTLQSCRVIPPSLCPGMEQQCSFIVKNIKNPHYLLFFGNLEARY